MPLNELKKKANHAKDAVTNEVKASKFIQKGDLTLIQFGFDDIFKLGSRDIQLILREVDRHKVAIALKGIDPKQQKIILCNMSKQNERYVQEDMDFMGRLLESTVLDARNEIKNIAISLRLRGLIVFPHEGIV